MANLLSNTTVGGYQSIHTGNIGSYAITSIPTSFSSITVTSSFDTASNDIYASMRVIRNNSSTYQDGMYIGYGNSGSGITRIFGGGSTSGALEKYATYTYEPGSFRAPIFYDSNDTNYYGDFAGTSRFNNLYIEGGVASVYNASGYSSAAIEVRERSFAGVQDDTWATAPRIGFHWGGRVASQIALASNGRIHILNDPGTANEAFQAGIIYSSGYGDSTQWKTAYDWGNHASAGYLTSLPSHNHDDRYYTESESDSRFIRKNTWEGNSYIGTGGDIYGTVFFDSNNSAYYVDPNSNSNITNLSVVGYQSIGGQTSNGQSNYQWDGADYRNPDQWTARLILRRDNATTGINGSIPSLVIFNNNGANQTTASMVFATNECVTGSNSVNLAGIIAKKESVGNCGGWSSGSLNFFVKNFGARVDSLTLTPDGNATFSGIVYSTGYGNSSQWNTAYGWGNHASAGYLTSLPSHNHDDRYYTESEIDSQISNRLYQARANGLNVNAFNATGLYRGSTGDWSNRPTIIHNGGALLTIDTHPGEYHSQLFFDTGGDRLYFRNANGGSWGSWLTMLHSGNYTSYSPSLTGSGASGTWSINVTGNADTVDGLHASSFVRRDTTGQFLKPYQEYGSTISNSTVPSSLVSDMGGGGLRVDFLNGASFGTWAHAITFSGYNGYNMYQLAGHYKGSGGEGPDLYVRCEPNHGQSTWSSWQKLWHSGHFSDATITNWNTAYSWGNHASQSYLTSYSETDTLATVTGRGASTTASISAANFQNQYQVLSLNNIKTPGLYNYDGGITGTQPLGSEWYNVRTIELGADGRYSQFVMPYSVDRIFYRRKADAGFAAYVELYHTGNLTNLNQLSNGPGYITSSALSPYLPLSGGTLTEGNYFYFRSNRGAYLGVLDSPSLQVYATGGNAAFMSFHRGGNYAVNFGLDADNVMRIGGWSASSNRWQLDMSGNNLIAGNYYGGGAGLTGTASSLNVGYATTAGALSSMNISQFTNNSGYLTSGLSTSGDSEQEVGLRYASWNDGVRRMNTDPRWNESGYDADLGCLHIWSWTAAGVAYGRAGIALFNGSAYQYLTTKAGQTGMFVNNQEIIHSGNIGSQSVSYASSAGSVAWTNVSSRPTALSQFTNDLGNYGGFLTSITAHTHAISDVTGLQTALDGKQAAGSYAASSHTHDDRYYTESESDTRFARKDTDAAISGNLVIGNGTYGNSTAYGNSGAKLMFSGSDGDAQGNYYIGTNHDNYGGDYSKLELRWHTGIRMGAQPSYGGIRFYETEDLGTVIFSVGTGDSHVRVTNNLYVGGNLALHAGNYNSYSPTLTGTGASGTWGISVTGSAGSVAWTNVSSRPTALSQFSNDLGNYGGWITSSGSISGSAGSVTGLTLTSSANGINPDSVTQNQIGYNTSVSLFGQTDGGLYSSAYSSSWIHQIYGDFRTGQIAIRGKNSGSWQAWRTVLDSSNYTSYAPSLTGSGASGTWGISITGNAATVGGYAVSGSVGANTVVIRDANNYIYAHYINSNVSETENPTINSFYTSNGDGWLRKSSVAHVKSQLGLGSMAYESSGTYQTVSGAINTGNIASQSVSYATISQQLTKFGDIYGQDWNSYFITGKLIVSNALGHTGSNRPSDSYGYGTALSYGETGGPLMQMYFPEDVANGGGAYRALAYRSGYNGSWSAWKTVVNQVGNTCTVAGSNGTGLQIHSNVSYNQDPLTYFLLRGQADSSWKALKIRLTGDAGGQDIEFRRIAENSTDARMFYVPRGANQVIFDYTVVQPSDSRLKDNLTPITNPVDKIKSLRGVEFDWNSGEHVGTHDVGLIAQDVEAVLPEAVTTQEDGYKNLAYTKVIPLLVEAMKEQQTMIEALRAEIELLKNK